MRSQRVFRSLILCRVGGWRVGVLACWRHALKVGLRLCVGCRLRWFLAGPARENPEVRIETPRWRFASAFPRGCGFAVGSGGHALWVRVVMRVMASSFMGSGDNTH